MDNQEIFFKPHLTGKRFDTHSLPVELLSDFSAIEELIIEMAKKNYLDSNPSKKRIPKGFSDGISLNLSNVEEGSVFTSFVLACSLTANGLFPDASLLTYFEKAKEQFVSLLISADNQDSDNELVTQYNTYFNRIGKNLLPDEAIDFTPEKKERKAILTTVSREKILNSASKKIVSELPFSLYVRISELNKSKQTFSIERENLLIQNIDIPKDFKEVIYSSFDGFEKEIYVKLEGVGICNSLGKTTSIKQISTIEVVDPLNISFRLEQLSTLKKGWYNGEGKAIKKSYLDSFKQIFENQFNQELCLPVIFPTVDGNIQLEWSNEELDISIKTDFLNSTAYFHQLNLETDEEIEFDFQLSEKEQWKKINSLLNNFVR